MCVQLVTHYITPLQPNLMLITKPLLNAEIIEIIATKHIICDFYITCSL